MQLSHVHIFSISSDSILHPSILHLRIIIHNLIRIFRSKSILLPNNVHPLSPIIPSPFGLNSPCSSVLFKLCLLHLNSFIPLFSIEATTLSKSAPTNSRHSHQNTENYQKSDSSSLVGKFACKSVLIGHWALIRGY